MTRLKAVREDSGDRILPVIYSDNYFTLMPEENRTLRWNQTMPTRAARVRVLWSAGST
jgi:Exo-beta-D-glucosaminidase Ig-fold domain